MALEAVPLLKEQSKVCWDIETTFKTAPAAATWQSLGRLEEWDEPGVVKAIARQAIAGAGAEAASIHAVGTSYGPFALGPMEIQDPRIMGFGWGQEVNLPVALSGGYYRHTASATTNGRLPSMGLQFADYKAGTLTDGLTYLGVLMPRIGVRGEEANEDGSGGMVRWTPTLLPHDHSTAVAGKAVTLPTTEPYSKKHATIQFYNSDTDWRIHGWDYVRDSHATPNWYHRSTDQGKPNEAPPQGIDHQISLDIVADGHSNSGSLIRDIVANEVKGNAQIKYVRTANQDEWAINLTDIMLERAPKVHRRGKIRYNAQGYARVSTFEWVDQNSTRYFPA